MLQVFFASARMYTHVYVSTRMHKYMQIHTHTQTKGWCGETGSGFSGRILAYYTQAIPRMGWRVSGERSHDGAHLKSFPLSGLMIDK